MKRITLSFTFLFAIAAAHAQLQKHALVLGFDASYSSSKQNYYNAAGTTLPGDIAVTSFSIVPNIGCFLSDRWLIGVHSTITINNRKDNFHGYANLSPKTVDKAITAYVRHYTKAGEKFYFFLQGDITWGTGNLTTSLYDPQTGAVLPSTEVTHSFRAGIRPGIVYFITPRLGLESTIGFLGFIRSYAANDDLNVREKNIENTFGITINPSTVNLGFRFYLGKRK